MKNPNSRRPAADPPPPVRPWMCGKVHAVLVKAGRPLTRGELRMYIAGAPKTADLQAALDVLVAEGAAERGEQPGRFEWQRYVVYRAV